MAKTGQQLIDRIGWLINDVNHKAFDETFKLNEINLIQNSRISDFLEPYIREQDIPLVDGSTSYDLPEDQISLKYAYTNLDQGHLVLNSSYSDIDKSYYKDTVESKTPTIGDKLMFRDKVSANKIEMFPRVNAANINKNSVHHSGNLPDSASEKDIWVDNDSYIYSCSEGYSEAYATLTIADRPDTDIVFTAIDSGTKYIKVAILRDESSTSLVKTGSGTYSSPYIYTFKLTDADNSNDTIISLLGVDADLSASGSSATDGTITEFSATYLDNPNESKWVRYNITVVYKAKLPDLSLVTDTLHPSIVAPLSDGEAICYLAAANLIMMKRGGDKNKANYYSGIGNSLLRSAKFANKKKTGPISMIPVYYN